MPWLLLAATIATEVAGTICLKLSEGLRHLLPTVLMLLLYGASFALLALVVKYLSISVVYAIWSGAGTAIIAGVGMMWFREPASLVRIGFIGLIVFGVVGLNLVGGKG